MKYELHLMVTGTRKVNGRHQYRLASTGKWVSRQRVYQIRNNHEGLCGLCAAPVAHDSKVFCPYHIEQARTRTRNNYRLKAGIPLRARVKVTKPQGPHR